MRERKGPEQQSLAGVGVGEADAYSQSTFAKCAPRGEEAVAFLGFRECEEDHPAVGLVRSEYRFLEGRLLEEPVDLVLRRGAQGSVLALGCGRDHLDG
jgi:hypothetical protein